MSLDRRGFFGVMAVAPAALAVGLPGTAALAAARRVSSEAGDPGEHVLAALHADGYQVRVYLDGEEQGSVLTADADRGYVRRLRLSPEGNVCWLPGSNAISIEEVCGRVEIRVSRRKA